MPWPFFLHMQIFPLPRWLEDGAIMAFSAYVYDIIFDMRKMVILLSRQLLYYPGTDMALWVRRWFAEVCRFAFSRWVALASKRFHESALPVYKVRHLNDMFLCKRGIVCAIAWLDSTGAVHGTKDSNGSEALRTRSPHPSFVLLFHRTTRTMAALEQQLALV